MVTEDSQNTFVDSCISETFCGFQNSAQHPEASPAPVLSYGFTQTSSNSLMYESKKGFPKKAICNYIEWCINSALTKRSNTVYTCIDVWDQFVFRNGFLFLQR